MGGNTLDAEHELKEYIYESIEHMNEEYFNGMFSDFYGDDFYQWTLEEGHGDFMEDRFLSAQKVYTDKMLSAQNRLTIGFKNDK